VTHMQAELHLTVREFRHSSKDPTCCRGVISSTLMSSAVSSFLSSLGGSPHDKPSIKKRISGVEGLFGTGPLIGDRGRGKEERSAASTGPTMNELIEWSR
jgi:hypothetical protein